MKKLENIKRTLKNFKTLYDIDFELKLETIKKQVTDLNKQIWHQKQMEIENNLLLKSLRQDPWLALSKDLHKGGRCFLLGTGPSINKMDLSLLKNEITMGVNGIFLIDSLKLDYYVSVSHMFWKHHHKTMKNYCCKRRFFPDYLKDALESDCPTSWLTSIELPEHKRLQKESPWFFSYSPDRYIVLGGTVIFVCLQILFYLGFSEVILLGIDHDYGIAKEKLGPRGLLYSTKKLDAHFTDKYYPKDCGKVHIDIAGSERGYKLANEAFKKAGRSIVNATPGTKLDVFPFVKFSDVI